MKNKTFFVSILVALTFINVNAQDIVYARQQLKKLCSPEFYGRGYYKKSDKIAADKVPFHVYENLFKLIVETVDELKKQEIQSQQ